MTCFLVSFVRSWEGHSSRVPADLGDQGGRRSAVSCHVATSDTLGQNAVIKQSDAPLSVEFSRLGNWRGCLSWLIVSWVVRPSVTGGIGHVLDRKSVVSGKSGAVGLAFGGCRHIKKKQIRRVHNRQQY